MTHNVLGNIKERYIIFTLQLPMIHSWNVHETHNATLIKRWKKSTIEA